ncbi:unnamed protein product [Paramecium octaurelia]|uniref:GPN-loop GTPase n=1 Tax=Paramecium octaurelia TaxID=43137 RepID=A0A8S1V1B3_PAROT|nr:unnamed protein product [Paramecium octaurelia]
MDIEFQIKENKIAILIIGMAGTGKTTFVQQLSKQLKNEKHTLINLDPAVYSLPYEPEEDIRKSINYKELMTKNKLGPNGAIMTALNLYSLQLNQLIEKIEKSDSNIQIIDTPGQIEVFTWSASGNLISQTLSMSMPTIIFYVIDIARCQNPNSFMSNLLFSCSIFYKFKLPMVIVFNKCDVADSKQPLEWLRNYDSFTEALKNKDTYLSTLSKQMVLTLEEFYNNFTVLEVSSLTGQGFEKINEVIATAKQEYMNITLVDIQKRMNDQKQKNYDKQINQITQKIQNL